MCALCCSITGVIVSLEFGLTGRRGEIRMALARVFQTGSWLCERFIAVITQVGSFTCMCANMTHQGKLHSKRLAADMTHVGTDTCMDPAMTLQIIGLGEGLAALVTLKWSFATVDQLVSC